VMRGKEEIATGKTITLRRGKDEVKQVPAGSECGVELDLKGDLEAIKEGDTLVFYELEQTRKPLGL
jgi:translation initiation factor IF-2